MNCAYLDVGDDERFLFSSEWELRLLGNDQLGIWLGFEKIRSIKLLVGKLILLIL